MTKTSSQESFIQETPYDEEYFEYGLIAGISSYMNYSWLPELTLRMAHFFVTDLPIDHGARVLDYGCAKGFVVKALRMLDIEADGVDISDYAIANADGAIAQHCRLIEGVNDQRLFDGNTYDWLISKDVLEHIPEDQVRILLTRARGKVRKMFLVLPLGADDTSGRFVIPEYDRDVTHILPRTAEWWSRLFEECGWTVEKMSYTFRGCKENWTSCFPKGNAFFIIKEG